MQRVDWIETASTSVSGLPLPFGKGPGPDCPQLLAPGKGYKLG